MDKKDRNFMNKTGGIKYLLNVAIVACLHS